MSSAAFARAHARWLEPLESSPEFDEWEEAQQEKTELLAKVSRLLEGWYEEVSTLDELHEVIGYIDVDVDRIKKIREQLAELEDLFPVPYRDPDPDEGW